MRKFWMVVRKPGAAADEACKGRWMGPRHRHYSHAAAREEAERLTDKLGVPFAVLGMSDSDFFVPEGSEEVLHENNA